MERRDPETIVQLRSSPVAAHGRRTYRSREPLQVAEGPSRFILEAASEEDRAAIGRLRHEVFARELGQHSPNPAGSLSDALDDFNCYLVAREGDRIAGFISITPPGRSYSVEKYLSRAELPFPCDQGLHEVRLLTVLEPYRRSPLALLLMYAALRWVEAQGGTRILALGRREVVDLYLKVGLEPLGRAVRSGAVLYDLLSATVEQIRSRELRFSRQLALLERSTDWRLPMALRRPAGCFHGGAFFEAIGPEFDDLSRRERVINADVLDAWFPPSPCAIRALRDHLEWTLRTSPPTACEGLVRAIARARGVPAASLLPGAGSSDLIFLALREWVRPSSRVLLPDPTYGEYVHLLERVIGARTERLVLRREEGYSLEPGRLAAALEEGPDLAVLVNPNSPTGRHLPRAELEAILRLAPARTRVLIDETYVDYVSPEQSLEAFAARSANVAVLKSLSKVYALSGARAAYLCASPLLLEGLRALTPPWAVSLPGQIAAVMALGDPDYYRERWQETRLLREDLASGLRDLGLECIPGSANFILCHLSDGAPPAAPVVDRCRRQGLYLRDAGPMGSTLGDRALRIAVKDASTNRRMLEILGRALD